MVAIEIENKVDMMLECLDIDIEYLQMNLLRLNDLRAFVIKRDDKALTQLLENIQKESEKYKHNETKRQILRKEIADLLEYKIEQITLSMLANQLSQTRQELINTKRTQLKTLVTQFRKEYAGTAILLSECSRFNKLLIKSVFEMGKTGSVYYNANGKATTHYF